MKKLTIEEKQIYQDAKKFNTNYKYWLSQKSSVINLNPYYKTRKTLKLE